MTVASASGEVELPREPQRAIGMYSTDVDILITLGFPLADQQPIRADGLRRVRPRNDLRIPQRPDGRPEHARRGARE